MKLSEISSKDVINDEDGVKLGKITDVEIDIATGVIQNVTVYRGFRIFNAFSKDSYLIPWNRILKIGNDVVIVENNPKKEKQI